MMDRDALADPGGSPLDPDRVGYFNWRFVFLNNVAVDPPVSPVLDSMGFVYRLDR